MTFAENLAFLRKKNNITQEQLAERLEVTRQSVSKWESGGSFPEMETLLKISEMFGVNIDALLKGDVKAESAEDTHAYDRHMNSFSRMISAGVGLVLFGLATLLFLNSGYHLRQIPVMIFLGFVVAAVSIFIVSGIRHGDYVKEHPRIEPFYTREELDAHKRKFPAFIAGPVALILIGIILLVGSENLPLPAGFGEDFYVSVFLFMVAAAVTCLVYAGIQHGKYNIEQYNKEKEREAELEKSGRNDLIGKICGVIMLFATAIFLLCGFLWGKWHLAAVIYPVAGIFCGIVGTILSDIKK